MPLRHLKQAHAQQWNHHITPPAYRARIIVVVVEFDAIMIDFSGENTGSRKAMLRSLEKRERKYTAGRDGG